MKKIIEDGYYLFVYSEVDRLMNALNASLRHDHNMALFKKTGNDIKLIRHWEFERFTGYKHHGVAFPSSENFINFIDRLLADIGLSHKDMVKIIGTPCGLDENIDEIVDKYPGIVYHAISHLFSSMFLNTSKVKEMDVVALAFDGGPDILIDKNANKKNFFCGAVLKKGKVVDLFDIPSPGAHWAYASNYFNMPEGTLMALAYASTMTSKEVFDGFPEYKRASDKRALGLYMDKLIKTIMNYDLSKKDSSLYTDYDERFTEEENKISMIMKIIQKESINQIIRLVEKIIVKYDINPQNAILSLSGGFALNCPNNTEIMNHFGFKEQLSCPCVNDGGLALGMGINYFYNNCDFNFTFENAYYGADDLRNIQDALKDYEDYIETINYGLEYIAEDIANMPIVWFDGKAEVGPRALGHRSIIANPTKIEHKNLLNQYKIREWWRPVAPVVLEEKLNEWFSRAFRSDYMLNNFKIIDDKRDIVPAIVHLDGTCRVQTVNENSDKTLYEIIKKFYQLTGIPIVCNTSLNDHGEPIINNIEQAINFALRKKIDVVYINGYRIKLKRHDAYPEKKWLKRDDSLLKLDESEKDIVLKEENPFGLPKEDLLIYKYNPRFHKFSLKKESDVEKFENIVDKIKATSLDLKGIEIISSHGD